MASSVEALITPEVMRWARDRMRLTVEEAARKIGRPVDEILAWENGSKLPTFAQLRKASEVYKRPLAVFYLPSPPKDFDTLRDFRSLPESYPRQYSTELALLIRTVEYRHNWLSEYLQSQGEEPLPFVESASVDMPPTTVARSIRDVLGIKTSEIMSLRSRDDAFLYWIRKAEAAGIFVLRGRDIPTEEARGFVMSDRFAPMVFVNLKDRVNGRIFTLAHEMAHVWLGHSGISNLELTGKSESPQDRRIEVFCNQVAAEVILDQQEFQRAWSSLAVVGIDEKITETSRRFKVSELVIARRLLQEGRIAQNIYDQVQARSNQANADPKDDREKPGHVDHGRKMATRFGNQFARTVLSGYFSGAVSGSEASDLLNVKINNFDKLAKTVHYGIG